ncbi:thymidylate synthase [Bradyrhizobium sp. 146]|uniref:thymidylate synthase n=1 Tax=Bradyrhizobium sp. 146 TaxID=2782622 RepID=UPI001FF7BB21|nr:thymidylate synthase [Bradyrhizobium sp. 146]
MSSKNMSLNRALRAKNANEAFAETLKAVRNSGHFVASDDSASIGSGRSTTEIINFSMEVESPRDRLILNPQRPMNIVTSVARFVWMMSGNNRLEDIAFYEPKVSKFTDDNLTVPGSDYGMRMFQPRPGLDQISGILQELRKRKQSRRATVAVFHPEDAVRQGSADIPCTFGLNFLIRDGQLYSTTIMRSNNAVQLLPFNLFEFSMLAEVIAVEAGVELGPMTHLALSMHVYENDIASVDSIVEGARKAPASLMEAMPGDPLKKINHLAQMEARLRHRERIAL